jgi:hypothetical protein
MILIVALFSGCIYEKGGITEDMKSNLLSFKQEDVDFSKELNVNLRSQNKLQGKIIKERNDDILTIKYITEETGCPHFEGGIILREDTLDLYYQDVAFRPVKCIDYFELTYEIDLSDLRFKEVKINRLEAIDKGFQLAF